MLSISERPRRRLRLVRSASRRRPRAARAQPARQRRLLPSSDVERSFDSAVQGRAQTSISSCPPADAVQLEVRALQVPPGTPLSGRGA
ncbi:hypothetical protein FA09DRAFT_328116 [Tilletiopsis washingtonensis]|uniref:Uncharacterized protein n=1 Tax=Tilletiopsis washingtonensis TaxID=58919 RepID=A0A316ZI75_9BASI|nr:hypothetical protein FA09DRAFT_328116 [Tilletiopsis washingtonensis]PWN99973.1 hypothetical protein FA09DRAFT_328116 [Tilletiopsis washingtonensis]